MTPVNPHMGIQVEASGLGAPDARPALLTGRSAELLGVLGGMGPLASAEFLKTIYEEGVHGPEQSAPAVVLHSDPSMPDRTEAFLNGRSDVVLARFITALARLHAEGVSSIVVCCITIHYLLPRLPAELRARVLSLIDVIGEAVQQSTRRHLLICTTGTRRLRLFESHPAWPILQPRIVLPDGDDQELIHRTIYQVKENGNLQVLVGTVERLLRKYEVDSFIAGCTEIHFAAKWFARTAASRSGYGCIDPLLIIATGLADRMRSARESIHSQ
jgi:aspartate racemase